MTKKLKTEPEGTLVLQTLAMPANTNPYGNVFGGWIMSQMDVGGGILAKEIAQSRVATVNVSTMTFHKPALVGDVICCYAKCIKTGYTSVTIAIEIWVKKVISRPEDDCYVCITEAVFTYVSIDKNFSPRPLSHDYQHLNEEQLEKQRHNLTNKE